MIPRLREEREAYLLGLLRVAIATLLLLHSFKLARSYSADYFGDVFHMPLLPEAWVPSQRGFLLLLAVQAVCCVAAAFGRWARPALLLAALCGLFGMFCDRLQFHNNRYTLLLLALLVPFTPCDRSFVLRRGAAEAGVGPRFAAYSIGAQLSLVYLASSLGKLLDADWRGGQVMLLRFAVGRDAAAGHLPAALLDLLAAPWFASAASKAAIAAELFLALGLWFGRTRALALWMGVMFHAGIELSARVELFSYTMLSGYLVFVTPELRQRRLLWPGRSGVLPAWARVLGRLDVLARFRQEARADQVGLVAFDRAGREHHGLSAFREIARATPLLFPLWVPLCVLTWRELVKPAA